MLKRSLFFKDSVTKIFTQKKIIVDIGGGLRISKKQGNRFNENMIWMEALMINVDYKILDPVDTYNPDIVGDIHNLPFANNSKDALICLSVLEHVENPKLAVEEMFRVLKTGGYLLVYVPFLYYYHAENGYYKDYWRFTKDTLNLLFKDFSKIEICNGRGAIETVFNLLPFGRNKFVVFAGQFLDKLFKKGESNQTSGYYIFLEK